MRRTIEQTATWKELGIFLLDRVYGFQVFKVEGSIRNQILSLGDALYKR